MTTQTLKFWRRIFNREAQPVPEWVEPAPVPTRRVVGPQIEIAPNDPLLAYLQSTSGPVEIERLRLESPAVTALRQAGVALIVPLISQGDLIGLINLGPRRSDQEYTGDDRRLLADLASQAAPAVRVAQLVKQQQAEARERERVAQELRVARLIQQTLLPQELPQIEGWSVAAHYQPAREVGGDFYDFHYFEDGQIGIVIGDVTDKGVPAALVMATTRTLLRAVSERLRSPGAVLERVNDLLHPDIPPKMFVTCLYALLDPGTGRLQFANAGHDLPYRHGAGGVDEMRARGMPLGLMPGMCYEEKEIQLRPGDSVVFYSDGLVEAHDRQREMFGFPRLRALLNEASAGTNVIAFLLEQLSRFTGDGWQQEDDVTLVTLQCHQRSRRESEDDATNDGTAMDGAATVIQPTMPQILGHWEVPSVQGNERQAMQEVAQAVQPLGLSAARLEKLKTAVAEATMNAMEHGNHYRAEIPVIVQVFTRAGQLVVHITDQDSAGKDIKAVETPDLELKLAGMQSPRGWGLFLIQNMVDEMNVIQDGTEHTLELIFNLDEGANQ